MKKILFILFITLFLAIAAVPRAASAINIISRSQWGANEELTFQSNQTPSSLSLNGTTTDAEEQTTVEEQDPEIERVVTHDENGREYAWPLQYARDIKFIVIHYTAVTRNLDNPIQDIRNIYQSHAVFRGWGDIGYNYLIDRQGNIYEGRKGGNKVIGGHARPVNKVSVGISLMGNYEEEELPGPMVKGLIDLIDELTRRYNIDPAGQTEYRGRTYPNIHGHEDNSPKLDPGRFGRQKIPFIRRLLAYKQNRPSEPQTNGTTSSFRVLDVDNLAIAAPGQNAEFTIRIRNRSNRSWNNETYLENTSDPELPRIFARLDDLRVRPNGTGEFKAQIPGLFVSGLRMPDLKLVINGTIRSEETFPFPIMIEGLRATYEIVGRQDPPEIMEAGQRATAWIMLRNTGNFTWRRSGPNAIRIGTLRERDHESPLFKGLTRIGRLSEREVRPGETGKFIFRVEAGLPAQTYNEYFTPVIDGATWFPDQGMHFTVTVQEREKPLRVALSFNSKKARIRSANGMTLYSNRRIIQSFSENQIAEVRMSGNGEYTVKNGRQRLTLNSPPRFVANENGILEIANFSNRPAWNQNLNDNLYRGALEIRKVENKLTIINELLLEDYLKGIAEVSNGDPPEKIKTIIILARSYAKYYRDIGRKFPGKPYHLDDDPNHTQKYLGYGVESRSPNIALAVEATNGKIVTYQERQIMTPYFSQSDGRTRSAQEVWGWTNTPYLQSVPDAFCGATELRGHGVGLSGCGATELARQGFLAEEIIKYYYQGVEITDQQ